MLRTPIAGILFDKDGTLLDFDESWAPVNRKLALLAAGGDQPLADRMLLACGMDPVTGHVEADSLFASGNTRDISQGLIAAGSAIPMNVLMPLLDDLFADSAALSVPVTDLAALFKRLHGAGYKLGIASSDNQKAIWHIVERFGLTAYVDYVAGYDSGHGVKPEAGMVLGFCKATGLVPSQVAVVGDNNHDMHMGKAAGAGLRIAVLSGTGSRRTLEATSDHCLNDITELERLLA